MKNITKILASIMLLALPFSAGATTLFPSGGGTGTSVAPTYGQVLVGTASGVYAPRATSTLGIQSGTTLDWMFPNNATSTLIDFQGGLKFSNILQGFAYIGSGGILNSIASSSIFGFTPISNQLTKGYTIVGNDSGVAQATSSLFISSTGNVGIGTTGPGARLTIYEPNSSRHIANFSEYGWASTQAPASPFIRVENPLASQPTYSFNGDNDTGMYYPQVANNIAFSTGGTEKVRINSTGNVGIGTTSPSQLLTVGNNNQFTVSSNATGTVVIGTPGGESNLTLNGGHSYAYYTKLSSVGAEFTINTNAQSLNLVSTARSSWTAYGGGWSSGITMNATNPMTWSGGPTFVPMSATFSNTAGNTVGLKLSFNYNQVSTSTANNTDLLINRSVTSLGAGTTQLLFDAQVGGNSKFNISDVGKVYVAGNVGISTTSPFAKLSVVGDAFITGNITGANITATGTLDVTGNTTLTQATSTNLAITNITSSLLKTNANGSVVPAVAGTDYQAALGYTPLDQSLYYSTTTQTSITSLPNLSITKSQVSDFGTYLTTETDPLSLHLTDWYSTTTQKTISSLPALSITKSQVSDFGSYENPLTFSWPLIRSTNAISYGGLSTSSSAVIGNIPYFSGVNTFANVATTSASCSGGISCSTFNVLGSSPITLSSFTYPFPSAATSTLLTFSGGITASAGTVDLSGATVKQHLYPSYTTPATTTTWTATSTFAMGTAYVAETWNSIECFTDSSYLNVVISDGTNNMTLVAASSTPARFALTTNNTFTAGEKRYFIVGTTTTSGATYVSCTIDKTINQ